MEGAKLLKKTPIPGKTEVTTFTETGKTIQADPECSKKKDAAHMERTVQCPKILRLIFSDSIVTKHNTSAHGCDEEI